MTTKELVKREEEGVTVVPSRPPLKISPETIQETMQSIALLQGMVKDLLIRGVDYGRIPGTPQDSLWDPGASQIIGSFNCYPGERRILKLEDSDEKIVAIVEVPIISRATGQEVGSGIGAASTLETKYKYRWVDQPQQWGYDNTALKTFKTKRGKDDEGNDTTLYRIPNPEHSELLNTIVKMASKRAEVDAAESLPGVASVLRQMFSSKKFAKGGEKGDYEGPRWQRFYGELTRLGFTSAEAHQKLDVTSMKDWLASGKSLDQALEFLRGLSIASKQPEESSPPESMEETEEGADGEIPTAAPERPAPIIPKPSEQPIFRSWAELAQAAANLKVMPSEVFKRSGYKRWEGFPNFRDAWGIVEEIIAERAQKPKMV